MRTRNILTFLLILASFAVVAALWFAFRPKPVVQKNAVAIENEQSLKETEQGSQGVRSSNTTGLPLKLPEGFNISFFAKDVPGARVMQFDPRGNMVVSLLNAGQVMALADTDNDGTADERKILLRGLDHPHGSAFHCSQGSECRLYIGEENQVSVYDYNTQNLTASNPKKILDLPSDGGHDTRTLLIAPVNGQEKLFVHVGSSCNVCIERDNRRATILSANLDGSDSKVFASGLRNSVFLTTHPVTGKIWATENGRDRLGDDIPPDEINIVEEGKNYGWPVCYGKNIHDTDFDRNAIDPCGDKTPSYINIQAHSAPLGLAFIPEEAPWPEEYQHNLLVAYHGSWNRSVPTGYKVVRYKLDAQGKVLVDAAEDFIIGWTAPDGTVLGRPVGIVTRPDGVVYISDDKLGAIYRVTSTLSSGR